MKIPLESEVTRKEKIEQMEKKGESSCIFKEKENMESTKEERKKIIVENIDISIEKENTDFENIETTKKKANVDISEENIDMIVKKRKENSDIGSDIIEKENYSHITTTSGHKTEPFERKAENFVDKKSIASTQKANFFSTEKSLLAEKTTKFENTNLPLWKLGLISCLDNKSR